MQIMAGARAPAIPLESQWSSESGHAMYCGKLGEAKRFTKLKKFGLCWKTLHRSPPLASPGTSMNNLNWTAIATIAATILAAATSYLASEIRVMA